MVENRRAKTIRGERDTPWFHAPFDRRRPASRRSRKKGCGSEELKGDLSRSDRSLSEATASTTDDRGPFHFSLSFSLSLLTSVIIVRRITPWRPREDTMLEKHGGTDEPPWVWRCQRPGGASSKTQLSIVTSGKMAL